MSANCDYIYVEGLRFRTRDVSVVWKDADGFQHFVPLAKSGTGRAKFDADGIPLRLTPKDLRKMLKKGETIDVIVQATGTDHEAGADRAPDFHGDLQDVANHLVRRPLRLRLDPRCAEGRKGRSSFNNGVDAGILIGYPHLSGEVLRSLAFEQLLTAPYGERNRAEAVERMLWSLGLLDDESVALLLSDEFDRGFIKSSSRSSTPLELSALLLSDVRLVEKLIRDGKHTSIMLLEHNSIRPGYPLADPSARPAHVVLEEAALNILQVNPPTIAGSTWPAPHTGWRRLPEDPLDRYNYERGLRRMRAVGYVRNQEVLEGVLATDPIPSVRIAAIGQLTLWAREVTPGRPARQSIRDAVTRDPAPTVRLHALRRVDTDEDISWDDRETLVFDVALLDPDEYVRLKALELLETDSALLDVAVDTVVDPGTSRAARDMVFARIAAGSVPRRRAGIVAQTHTSMMGETRSTEGLAEAVVGSNNREMLERLVDMVGAPSSFSDLYAASDALRAVVGSNNREMLERLVDTLGAPSSFSDSYAASYALRAVRAVLDNPAITDEIYAKAFALSKELTTARDAANLREEQDREKKEAEERYAYWASVYAGHRIDEIEVALRHARGGNSERAMEVLFAPSQDYSSTHSGATKLGKTAIALSAAAGMSDADSIRQFKVLVDELNTRATTNDGDDFKELLYELLLRNPTTPPDMLPEIALSILQYEFQRASTPWHAGLAIVSRAESTSEDLAYVLQRASKASGRSGWHHVLAGLRDHPNATGEQKLVAAALLESWRPGEPPPPNTPR